jgi:hypothetical protein
MIIFATVMKKYDIMIDDRSNLSGGFPLTCCQIRQCHLHAHDAGDGCTSIQPHGRSGMTPVAYRGDGTNSRNRSGYDGMLIAGQAE